MQRTSKRATVREVGDGEIHTFVIIVSSTLLVHCQQGKLTEEPDSRSRGRSGTNKQTSERRAERYWKGVNGVADVARRTETVQLRSADGELDFMGTGASV